MGIATQETAIKYDLLGYNQVFISVAVESFKICPAVATEKSATQNASP